jgi:PAS domain S-box-containing protein
LPRSYLAAVDGIKVGPSAGSCGTAAYLDRRVIVDDVRDDPLWTDYRAAAADAGLVACWSTPIPGRDGRPAGTFAVYHKHPCRPSARELRLVDRFISLASAAIQHSGLIGELIESEGLFRRSFEDNAAGMALLGLDQRIERVNRAMVDISGYPADRLIGRPIASLFAAEWATEQVVADMLAGRVERLTQQTHLLVGDGERVAVEASTSVVRGVDGEPRRFTVTVLDLTQRQRAEQAEQARREAEVARLTAESHSRAKSMLLTTVSHEVRSPLQAITGFTELLRTLDLDAPRRQEALRQIDHAAHHLLRLVTDVLDISRVEANVLPIRLERVRVAAAVSDAMDLIEAEATARGVDLELRGDLTATAIADPQRLEQVALNLLGNAVRHGGAGGHVTVGIGTEGPTGHRCTVLTVEDDGPGIPDELLPDLFTPYVRGTGSDVDGYGLGLVLVSGLVTAMGGDVTAENRPERGARFRVRLRHDPEVGI